jgi:hypothetical protein
MIDPQRVKEIKERINLPISEETFADPVWRIGNLYQVVNKDGIQVQFVPNDAQCDLLWWVFVDGWTRVTILKARQLGFSTLICLIGMDYVIFHENSTFNIQSHNDDAAKELLREKVKFPFSQLPDELKLTVDTKNSSANELAFSDVWKIKSRVKIRGGTSQVLLLSEWGKVQAKDPTRSEEILTGALPTASSLKALVFNESTFEGSKSGHFYDQVIKSMNVDERNRTPLDSKFLFYPWYDDPTYRIPCYNKEVLSASTIDYFDRLSKEVGVDFDNDQMLWWQDMKASQGMFMGREYPSTPDEAMDAPVAGAIYADKLDKIEAKGQFRRQLYPNPKTPIWSVWDIGWRDSTAIWCVQWDGKELNWLDYFEDDHAYPHEYMGYLDRLPFDVYGYVLPWDAAQHDRTGTKTYEGDISKLANGKPVRVLPQCKDKWKGINDLRLLLDQSTVDRTRCAVGMGRLAKYRVKVDLKDGNKGQVPIHCDGSDAARYVAEGIEHNQLDMVIPRIDPREAMMQQSQIQEITND